MATLALHTLRQCVHVCAALRFYLLAVFSMHEEMSTNANLCNEVFSMAYGRQGN